MSVPVLECIGVEKTFSAGGRQVHAARSVDLTVGEGASVAIVGESGSGKSTLMRLCLGLMPVDGGSVRFRGEDWSSASRPQRRARLASIGAVFQEPFESLDPRQRVVDIVTEPMRLHDRLSRQERMDRAIEALSNVGLDESYLRKTPARLSGGQQQRVGIARAIVRRPELIFLDEPTSALDLSVQAQVLQILAGLRAELGAALVTVTHDLAVAGYLADWIVVMRHGAVVEQGPTDKILGSPESDYTRELIDATTVSLKGA